MLGPSRLPDAARSVGKGMREMRDSFQGITGDDEDEEKKLEAEEEFELEGRGPRRMEPDDSDAAPAASPGRS